jgi:hypothetical protein
MAAKGQNFLDFLSDTLAIQMLEDFIEGFIPEQKLGDSTMLVFVDWPIIFLLVLLTDSNA